MVANLPFIVVNKHIRVDMMSEVLSGLMCKFSVPLIDLNSPCYCPFFTLKLQ